MIKHKKKLLKIITFTFLIAAFAYPRIGNAQTTKKSAKNFILSAPNHSAIIFVWKNEKPVVKIAANAFAEDMHDITGIKPLVTSDPNQLGGSVVIIGTQQNPMIQKIEKENNVYKSDSAWEHFTINAFNSTGISAIKKALIICGSDARGTAFGAFALSKKIGISPWVWWADVKPQYQKEILLPMDIHIDESPSVKFRGIFLNDEDWGLRPWASAGLDAAHKNIGPNTYAKIFELLLRLKANTIWPAMHPGTIPFFQIPENIKVAEQYDIYVGSSHAEPMLRNNVGEWSEKTMGAFNYITNRDSIYSYWEKRVAQTAKDNVIYTVGIRGVHDSKMEGAKTLSEKVSLLTQVLKDQRHLLAKYVNKDLTQIPQVFVPYKEVLPIYNAHLKVPDDITLMWPDDNYGYIRRLSNPTEQQRSGSAGVYYHISYWGSPMDYLWLTTTNPALIFEEMKKAWDLGAKRMWIVNVGDLKPAEYDLQFFMDMAWNINSINAGDIQTHLENWAASTFGEKNAKAITKIMQEYYHLAYERRPEFLDWSDQTKNNTTPSVHPFTTAKEISNRINQYKAIAEQAQEVKRNIPTTLQDAYFELVLYPVLGATYMNEKIMYTQRNKALAAYNLPAAEDYGMRATNAYDSIVKITKYYNDSLANGKWKGIMSMAPRNRIVFNRPTITPIKETNASGIMILPEGSNTLTDANGTYTLPNFNSYNHQQHFIEFFNKGKENIHWKIVNQPNWLQLNKNNGSLDKSEKLELSINWKKIPKDTQRGSFTFTAENQSFNIEIAIEQPLKNIADKQPVNTGMHIVIDANEFTKSHNYSQKYTWTNIKGLGYSSNATMLYPIPPVKDIALSQSYLDYKFYAEKSGAATINICTVPTFPIYQKTDVSVGISLDNIGMLQKSFVTKEKDHTWEDNVIRNQAFNIFNYPNLTKGWHIMRVYALNPGVVLDQVRIDFE